MEKPEIIGSWFNTGYHGHSRTKARPDFVNEFRYLAKPQPPRLFITRSTVPTAKQHPFTHHDNKHNYISCSSIIENQVSSRKKFKNRSNGFDKDFLTWFPLRPAYDSTNVAGSLLSTYQNEFTSSCPYRPYLVNRPKTSFDGNRTSTTYRYAYGKDDPNKPALEAATDYGIPLGLNTQLKSKKGDGRESVASCLVWHLPRAPTQLAVCSKTSSHCIKGCTPNATEISHIMPHPRPPAYCKPESPNNLSNGHLDVTEKLAGNQPSASSVVAPSRPQSPKGAEVSSNKPPTSGDFSAPHTPAASYVTAVCEPPSV